MRRDVVTRRALLVGGAALLGMPERAAAGPVRRIVSLGGAVTEILYRLGREGEVVGIDSTSQYPREALATKPNVGYVRALGVEGILSLKPSIVVAIQGAGPPDVLRLVEAAGIPLVFVPDDPTPDGVLHRVRAVAAAVEAPAEGERLMREIEDGFARVAQARSAIVRPRRVLFVLSLQNGRPLVGGQGTSADGMLALAGARNAVTVGGWKPLSDEGVIAAAPETVVMVSRGPDQAPAPDLFRLPSFAATPAAASRALVTMDGLYLLGFGPRTPQAALDLMAALEPDAALARARREAP